jgi:hypothetical protein
MTTTNFARDQYRKAARVGYAIYGPCKTSAERDYRLMLGTGIFKDQEPDPLMWGFGKTAIVQLKARIKFMLDAGIDQSSHTVY